MRNLLVYASQYGSTEKAAQMISEEWGDCDLISLRDRKQLKSLNWDDYEKVALGGSIKIGRMDKNVVKWMEKNKSRLKAKPHGFFICCLAPEDKQEEYWGWVDPELKASALACEGLGGEMLLEKMNPIIRSMMKKINGTDENIHKLDRKKAAAFAQKMKSHG